MQGPGGVSLGVRMTGGYGAALVALFIGPEAGGDRSRGMKPAFEAKDVACATAGEVAEADLVRCFRRRGHADPEPGLVIPWDGGGDAIAAELEKLLQK